MSSVNTSALSYERYVICMQHFCSVNNFILCHVYSGCDIDCILCVGYRHIINHFLITHAEIAETINRYLTLMTSLGRLMLSLCVPTSINRLECNHSPLLDGVKLLIPCFSFSEVPDDSDVVYYKIETPLRGLYCFSW